MIKEIRGEGLFCGIVFQPPRALAMRSLFRGFQGHPSWYVRADCVVMRMFNDKNILTQICGNNFMVLKAAPPLVVSEQQIEAFVEGISDVVSMMHSSATFWSDAIKLGRRAVSG